MPHFGRGHPGTDKVVDRQFVSPRELKDSPIPASQRRQNFSWTWCIFFVGDGGDSCKASRIVWRSTQCYDDPGLLRQSLGFSRGNSLAGSSTDTTTFSIKLFGELLEFSTLALAFPTFLIIHDRVVVVVVVIIDTPLGPGGWVHDALSV
jgi:hypothetical protein